MKIKVVSISGNLPTLSTRGSAGYDLRSITRGVIKPGTRQIINTGIKIQFPKRYYGRIAPRSNLAAKGIDIGAGVIDNDYRGEIKIIIINNGQDSFKYKYGTKLAQLIFTKYKTRTLKLVNTLNKTNRGEKGING